MFFKKFFLRRKHVQALRDADQAHRAAILAKAMWVSHPTVATLDKTMAMSALYMRAHKLVVETSRALGAK